MPLTVIVVSWSAARCLPLSLPEQHPNLRVGLFEKGTTAQHVRSGLMNFASRKHYQTSLARLYGLGLWNQQIVTHMMQEWSAGRGSAGKGKSDTIARLDGSLAVMFDDRAFSDVVKDVGTQRTLVGDEGAQVVFPGATAASTAPRFESLDDRAILARLPSLEPRIFTLSGVMSFRDEFAVDHLAFLRRMRDEAAEKYGVKFVYDTTATGFVTQQQQQQQPQSAAGDASPSVSTDASRLVAVSTSNGEVSGDAFVMCAGSHSKRLVRNSRLPLLRTPIPTFSTKTHYLSFPNPDAALPAAADGSSSSAASAASSSQRIFPATSLVLPDTHTVITPLATEIRVSSGDSLNLHDDPTADADVAAAALEPRLDSAVLKTLVADVSGVFPLVTKEVISQSGATVPHVALRTWSFDNQPLLGRYAASVPNLFINSGHGNLGWTNAVAAGQHVSSIVSGTTTFIQPDAFDPRRFESKKQ